MDYLDIQGAVAIGSISVNPGSGSVGSLLINSDTKSIAPLTVSGPISISAGTTGVGVVGTVNTLNIQRLASVQALGVGAGDNSNITAVTVNSPTTCFNAQLGRVSVSVNPISGSLGTLAIYGTRLTAGIDVTTIGPVGSVLISAENATCSALEVTGNIFVQPKGSSIGSFHVQGVSIVRGSVNATASLGVISNLSLTPRDGNDLAIHGDLFLRTVTNSTSRIDSVYMGPLATGAAFAVEALGGSIDNVRIVGSVSGLRFNSTFTVHSAAGAVSVTVANMRYV